MESPEPAGAAPAVANGESERQARRCERLEGRLARMTSALREAESRASEFRREASADGAWAQEARETLRVLDGARRQLREALQRQARELEGWKGEAAALAAKSGDLEAELEKRRAALAELEKRHEETCRTFALQAANHQRESQRLLGEIERVSSLQAQAQAELDRQRQTLEAERLRLLAEVNTAMESAEAIRREGIDALETARELKARPGSTSPQP